MNPILTGMRLAMLAIATLATVSLAGCCDCEEHPLNPSTDVGLYTGTNGFVINGGDYEYKKVNFDKSSVEYLDPFGDQRAIRLDLGTLAGTPTTLILALPSSSLAPGRYAWVPDAQSGPGTAYVTIEQDDEPVLLSRAGTTIITAGSNGLIVNGTFSGIVEDGDGEPYTIQGKFSATRVN